MSIHSRPASEMFRGAVLAVTMLLFVGGPGNTQPVATQGSAPSAGPFDQLAGSWSGSGTIDLSNGTHEPIKCRASYDVLEEQSKLQLNIRCASDSYNFDLRGSATYSAGAITELGASPPAMQPGPFPVRSMASAFRLWPRGHVHRRFGFDYAWRQSVGYD